jgi:hypothetical protein
VPREQPRDPLESLTADRHDLALDLDDAGEVWFLAEYLADTGHVKIMEEKHAMRVHFLHQEKTFQDHCRTCRPF